MLAPLLVVATSYGLLDADAYALSDELVAQARGQDLLTLLTVPVLVVVARAVAAGRHDRPLALLAGLQLYHAYTYASYAFAVPVNAVFVVYVAVLGLACFGTGATLLVLVRRAEDASGLAQPRRAVGVTLVGLALLFAVLWLGQLAQAWPDGEVAGSFGAGMPNPIHVLDLAFLLPATAATGLALRRRARWAAPVAVVLLVKLLTLAVAIDLMGVFMAVDGLAVDTGMTALFGVVTVALSWLLLDTWRRDCRRGVPGR